MARPRLPRGWLFMMLSTCGCVLIAGCAIDGYTWEKSRTIGEVRIRMFEVPDARTTCKKYLPDEEVMACAVLTADHCEIYVPPDSPALVAHESAHCFGYVHPGETRAFGASGW